jgi:CsoR family transcriptional regulator, copper-sensing transcriptional repressor
MSHRFNSRESAAQVRYPQNPMLDAEIQSTIDRRLARVEMRVRGISKLVADDTGCPRVLNELAAAQEALSRIAYDVARFHVAGCVPSAEPNSQAAQRLELVDIFDRFLA